MEFSYLLLSLLLFLSRFNCFFDSLNPHKDLIFGTWDRDPAYCTQKEVEAGGMARVVLVLFSRISTEFIRIVERKPGPISIGEN